VLLELMTERLVGHYIGDVEHYRRPGEVEEAKTREPLVRIRQALLAAGVCAEQIEALEAGVAGEVDAAARGALAAPAADPATVREHVYA
jgi:pyruvate dehydrogenase E1 component alpha subunit